MICITSLLAEDEVKVYTQRLSQTLVPKLFFAFCDPCFLSHFHMIFKQALSSFKQRAQSTTSLVFFNSRY